MESSSLGTDIRNLPVELMLRLPSGETVPYSVPAIVIIPSLTSSIAAATVSPAHGVVSHASQVSIEPSPPQTSQTVLSLPAAISDASVINSESRAAFDPAENGLTALGIAASTREVCLTVCYDALC